MNHHLSQKKLIPISVVILKIFKFKILILDKIILKFWLYKYYWNILKQVLTMFSTSILYLNTLNLTHLENVIYSQISSS